MKKIYIYLEGGNVSAVLGDKDLEVEVNIIDLDNLDDDAILAAKAEEINVAHEAGELKQLY